MNHLLTQGLLHLYFDIAFFAISGRLWFQWRRSGNLITKYLSLSFLFAGIEFLGLTTAILFFANSDTGIQILNGVVALPSSMVAISYGVAVISVMMPVAVFRPVLWMLRVLAAVMAVYNLALYQPLGVTRLGLLELTGPQWQIVIVTLLLMLTYVPIGVYSIYRTLRKGLSVRGVGLGLGILLVILFLPLTYQVTDYEAYLFLSGITALGFLLLVVGVIVHPSFADPRKHRIEFPKRGRPHPVAGKGRNRK